ncbi:hypothetical protein [Amycolatopsis lexingtonensis]|uniref:hypothetical protein n=1 Tax=Amycolatopsis lexingtonensis TaxID=218822 RepID=UPI003F72AEAB
MAYVRFQSAEPTAGTAEQEEFRRTNHAWYESHYTNPATIDPAVYDHAAGYLEILDAHDVRWDKLASHEAPGRVIYEDADQIVVVPFSCG